MSVVGWVVFGLIAGFIASRIVGGAGEGVIVDVVLGVVGAVVGGWLFAQFGWGGVTGFNPYSMFVAVVGAAGICFAGAMASFGVTPRCYQGDPGRWADELDRILDMAPVIVPGHGPIGGEEEVRDLQAYLRACVSADGDADAIPPGPWDAWRHREHDEVNVLWIETSGL